MDSYRENYRLENFPYNDLFSCNQPSCFDVNNKDEYDENFGKNIKSGCQSNIFLKDETIVKKYKSNNNENVVEVVTQENHFLSKFTHLPGVIKIKDIPDYNTVKDREKMIFMEYIRYDELTYYDELSLVDRIKACIQIIETMDIINKNCVVHRDLKFDNILIKSRNPLQVVITDFGLACYTKIYIPVKGNVGFRCPKLKDATHHIYNGTEDRYSIGMIVSKLLNFDKFIQGEINNFINDTSYKSSLLIKHLNGLQMKKMYQPNYHPKLKSLLDKTSITCSTIIQELISYNNNHKKIYELLFSVKILCNEYNFKKHEDTISLLKIYIEKLLKLNYYKNKYKKPLKELFTHI